MELTPLQVKWLNAVNCSIPSPFTQASSPPLNLLLGDYLQSVVAGNLAADSVGRARMADGFFNTATVIAKFAAASITKAAADAIFDAASVANDKLQAIILTADTDGRARVADGFFNAATAALKFGLQSIDSTLLKKSDVSTATGAVVPQGQGLLFRVADTASANYDLTVNCGTGTSFVVTGLTIIKEGNTGDVGNKIRLVSGTGTNYITDDVVVSGAIDTLATATTINTTYGTIANGTVLRVKHTKAGGNSAGLIVINGYKV